MTDIAVPTAAARPPFYRELYAQVLLGVIIGVVIGALFPTLGASLKPLGDAFVKLVRMMIAPIVFVTITTGIAGAADNKQVGKTFIRAMLLFYALTIIALVVGLVFVEAIRPGAGMNFDVKTIDPARAAQFVKQVNTTSFADFLLRLIPNTFFSPFAEGEVLSVLFIAVLTGFGLKLAGPPGEPFRRGLESFGRAIFAAFTLIMRLAPIGAGGAMAFIVATNGLSTVGNLGMLILTLWLAALFFVFVMLGVLARMHGFSLLKLLAYIREELLVVLGTASTGPVLPQMLIKLERLGCAKSSVGLTLPLGYSFNLDGTAIYLTLASLFLAQALNIHLSAWQIGSMLLLMLITSKGAAGVTGSGFVALVSTLAAMPDTLPVAAVVLIAGIDRFMSEARALSSLVSNAVSCIVISIWEGACDRERLRAELDRGSGVVDVASTPIRAG